MTLDLDMNSLLNSLLKIIDVFCLILQYVCAKLTCNYVNDLWKPEIKNFQCLFVFSIRMYRFIFKILSEECTTFVEIFFKLYGSIIPLFFFFTSSGKLEWKNYALCNVYLINVGVFSTNLSNSALLSHFSHFRLCVTP